MSEEKNLNNENEEIEAQSSDEAANAAENSENSEVIEESAENVSSEETENAAEEPAEEASDDAAEESAEEVSENTDSDIPEMANPDDIILEDNSTVSEKTEDTKQPANKKNIAAIIGAAVVIVILVVVFVMLSGNKYNKEFLNVTGRTVEEVADQSGMSLSEFLERYGLPADMPADTYENAAYYSIPIGKMASQIYGVELDTLKEQLGLDDYISEDTRWVDVVDNIPMSRVVASGQLDAFKEKYNLGDDVTEDTLYGEVRKQIDKQQLQARLDSENATPEPEEADDSDSEDTSSSDEAESSGTEATEAPAETPAA